MSRKITVRLSRNPMTIRLRCSTGWALISLALLLVACMPVSETSPANLRDQEGSLEPEPVETRIDTPKSINQEPRPTMKIPERVPTDLTTAIPPVTGEAPAELLDAIKSDLAALTGADRNDIVVVRDQAVVWSDGSLGCPQPGTIYTQAPVNGYWVIQKVGEVEYDYRAAESGRFFICESGGSPLINPPGESPHPGPTPEK